MQQPRDEPAAESQDQEGFDWQTEQQELRDNLQKLRLTAERAGAMLQDFDQLARVAQGNIAATDTLRQDINVLAGRLGLSLVSSKIVRTLKISTGNI